LIFQATVGSRYRLAARVGRISLLLGAALLMLASVAASLHAAGGKATSVELDFPTAAAPIPASAGGGFLIADSKDNEVKKVDTSGDITTVAGNGSDHGTGGEPDVTGDGGPAIKAELDDPTDAVTLPGGGFLIADATYNLGGGGTVREVSASGIITTVAGGARLVNGNYQVCAAATDSFGDGCSATQAELADPTSAVPLPGGGFLIADAGDSRIREVSATGIITTVAGGAPDSAGFTTVCPGATDSAGDGCPATQAVLNFPTAAIPFNIAGAAVSTPGSGFLIADPGGGGAASGSSMPGDCSVRYVNAAGIISTVAGTGTCGENGGTGPATSIELNAPTDARPTAGGGFLVADSYNCRVLKVSSLNAGKVTTVVPGTPSTCSSPDVIVGETTAAIPATGGGFLVADNGNRIQSVTSSGAVTTVAGAGATSRTHSPACSFTHRSNKVPLRAAGAKTKSTPKQPKDTLAVTLRCNQAAKIKVGGFVKETIGAKHHPSVKKLAISAHALSVRAGKSVALALKLPHAAISGLEHGAQESATLTLDAKNAHGSSRATTTITRLKSG
jgi:hypothetical protein